MDNTQKTSPLREKINFDHLGWTDAKLSLPHEAYDLVELKDALGNIRPGWWNGAAYETSQNCKPWQFFGATHWRKWKYTH